jgi:hypothetical protein
MKGGRTLALPQGAPRHCPWEHTAHGGTIPGPHGWQQSDVTVHPGWKKGMHASVVVVVVGQLGLLPGVGHASQQLVQLPTVPCFAVQWAASFLILHFVPLVVVRQQVTAPGLPQVEWEAHFLMKPAQLLFIRVVFACCVAQLTYAPWVSAPAQSQLAATAARAFAMSLLSGSVLGSHLA